MKVVFSFLLGCIACGVPLRFRWVFLGGSVVEDCFVIRVSLSSFEEQILWAWFWIR